MIQINSDKEMIKYQLIVVASSLVLCFGLVQLLPLVVEELSPREIVKMSSLIAIVLMMVYVKMSGYKKGDVVGDFVNIAMMGLFISRILMTKGTRGFYTIIFPVLICAFLLLIIYNTVKTLKGKVNERMVQMSCLILTFSIIAGVYLIEFLIT